MKVVSFEKLYHMDYNLDNIFAMSQYWKDCDVFRCVNPRPTSALLYAKNCSIVYTVGEKTFFAKEGSLIYIPKGSVYYSEFGKKSKEHISAYLIEFNTLNKNGEEFVFAESIMVMDGVKALEAGIFYDTPDIFKTANPCIAEAKASLYKLISSLSYNERIKDIYKSEFASIAEGIVYMENDTIQEKSISEIAKMCHVSSSHFRALFKKYSGVSPISYQLTAKINHAKRLLQLGDMTVGEVSEYMGFSDNAYFCKIFKKYTGVSPKAYLGKERV